MASASLKYHHGGACRHCRITGRGGLRCAAFHPLGSSTHVIPTSTHETGLLSITFFQGADFGTERLRDFSKITQLAGGGARISASYILLYCMERLSLIRMDPHTCYGSSPCPLRPEQLRGGSWLRTRCPLCLCRTASVALKSSKTRGHKPLPSVGCPSAWMGLRGTLGYKWAGGRVP